MAKHKIQTRSARPIIIRAPSGKKAAKMVRAGASKAAKLAAQEKHTFTALGAAGALGYARREGWLDNLPQIEAIGPEGSLALAAFIAGKFMKSEIANHLATGLGCVALNRLAAGDLGGGT
jgi:hypothetical protein